MKIPISIRYSFKETQPYIIVILRGPRYRIKPTPFRLLVDTGSPFTAITPWQASILGISARKLELDKDFASIVYGGYSFRKYLMTDLTLRLETDKGTRESFDLSSMSVLSHETLPPKEFRRIDNVLGCDFLKENNLLLHFDPASEDAWLTDERK